MSATTHSVLLAENEGFFFLQSHLGNPIKIDLDSRQTGCTGLYTEKTAGNSRGFFFLLNFEMANEDSLELKVHARM